MYGKFGLLAIFVSTACSSHKEDDNLEIKVSSITDESITSTSLDLSYLDDESDLKEKEQQLKRIASLTGSTLFEEQDINRARQTGALEELKIPPNFKSNKQIMDWARNQFIMGILAREMGDFFRAQNDYGGHIDNGIEAWLENSVNSSLAQVEEGAQKINDYVQTEAYGTISLSVDQQATIRTLIILLDAQHLSARLASDGKQVSPTFDQELQTAADSLLAGQLVVHIDSSSKVNKFVKAESLNTLGKLVFVSEQTSPDVVVHEALHTARNKLRTTEQTLRQEERYAHAAMAVYYYESRGNTSALERATKAEEGIVGQTARAKWSSESYMRSALSHKSEWLPSHYMVYLNHYALVESLKLKDQADPENAFTQTYWMALAYYANEYSQGNTEKANHYLDSFEKGLVRYEWYELISIELNKIQKELQKETDGIDLQQAEVAARRYLSVTIHQVETDRDFLKTKHTREDQWGAQMLSIRLLVLQAYQEALNKNLEGAQAKVDQIMAIPTQVGLTRDFTSAI